MATVDVTAYGACGDGETNNTEILQEAINACGDAGGGVVRIPAGEYLTAPLFLRDNVRVHIESGATVRGVADINSYPGIKGRWEGVEREVYASLFTGHDLQNVSITGRGTIDGRGKVWWATYREDEEEYDLGRDRPYPGQLNYPRPRVINLYDCEDVLIRDVTVTASPSWTIHPVYCKNIQIENVTVRNVESSVNTDGINPDSCKNVHISNCHIDVGDDCITIKSGYDRDGRRVGRACENVVITNCTMYHGHGGVVIGSEMSGDVRNVAISNCVFDGTDRGLRIKTARGRGGVVENVRASTIVMRDIQRSAFTLSMHYHGNPTKPEPITDETPELRNIHYENVTVADCGTVMLAEGLPEMPVTDVSLSNVHVEEARRGIIVSEGNNVLFDNITVNTEIGASALKASSVTNLDIDRLRNSDPDPKTPVLCLMDVDGALIQSCTAYEGTGTFLELTEESSVELSSNLLTRAERESVIVD